MNGHSSTSENTQRGPDRWFAITQTANVERIGRSAQPYVRQSTTLVPEIQHQALQDSRRAARARLEARQNSISKQPAAQDRRCKTQSTNERGDQALNSDLCQRYMLWIDGVGAWQLCAGQRFNIGSPSLERRSADIALLANVSRQHASLLHNGSDWKVQAHQLTAVAGRPVADSTVLRSGDQICLAERVKLGFRVPSPLGFSAVIDFESDHRPTYSVDGIILMTDHCLLGPQADHHVWCRHWSEMVVLFLQNGQLHCRSKAELSVNGVPVQGPAVLPHGAVVTAEDMRFRVEQME